jgi:hypothetical protein
MPTPDSPSSQPSASATPTAPADKPKRHRGLFNKAQLAEITLSEDIATKAADEPYKTKLADKKIDAAFVTAFADEAESARALSEGAASGKGAKKQALLNATGAEGKLIVALQAIQSAAKQRSRMDAVASPPPGKPVLLANYLIGQRLNASRSLLLQNSRTLIDLAKADTLPGYETAAQTEAVEALRTAYEKFEEDQADTNKETVDERTARDASIARLINMRLAIQHAIDGLYSYVDEANHTVRTLFGLPLDRTLAN